MYNTVLNNAKELETYILRIPPFPSPFNPSISYSIQLSTDSSL